MTNRLIHVGCGTKDRSKLKGFNGTEWHEVRIDIDPSVKPDVIGSLTDLGSIQTGEATAVYSSHNLEHLFAHQVPAALLEFHRVVAEDGFVVITCPDLQSVCAEVAKGRLLEPLYKSPAGPIAAIDIIFGLRKALASGNEYMAHRCGFTYPALARLMKDAGFQTTIGLKREKFLDLWILATKSARNENDLKQLAQTYLP